MAGTSDEASYERPFAGIRVVDMSQGVAGPGCGMLLAAHGADVIKIEPPQGDWIRALGTPRGDLSPMALAFNRGKRGVALDLKNPRGRDAALRMIDRADIAIQSARPGAAERLGLGYEQARARNPRLLYVSVSSYGREGPYAQRPGTDTVLQAWSGLMAINRDDAGRPRRVGFVLVDTATALYAFQAAATALYARRGEGRRIDVSLMQGAAALLAPKLVEAALEGAAPRPPNPPAGAYRTSDGWIAVTLVRESHYAELCAALGRPELATDPRFDTGTKRADRLDELTALVAAAIAERTTAEWLATMGAAGVLCSPINAPSEWLADEHVRAAAAAPAFDQPGIGSVPVPRLPGLPAAAHANLAAPAPHIGEHTEAVLAEHGYAPAEIAALRATGALGGRNNAAIGLIRRPAAALTTRSLPYATE